MNEQKYNELMENLKKLNEIRLSDNELPYRKATLNEQAIIKEKLPQIQNFSSILIGLIFLFLGPIISYFLFYDENKFLMFGIGVLFIIFYIIIFKKYIKTKEKIIKNKYLIITGKCINKTRINNKITRRKKSGYYLEMLTDEQVKIPMLSCIRSVFKNTNINDPIIIIKFNEIDYKIINLKN